ncbi:histidinol dehydrogenase [Microbacterium maritypicum]|uniref:histidinol dehydrogenase n=1 Tax=Microbacterium maritypicum TaxID=33918 RepID=UPI002672A412|nr:histidinol dehydrogenase [Microbacterium liquefaciens]WKT89587.1 histidinol dehydrogenase [Microbacterium liquefaciens]
MTQLTSTSIRIVDARGAQTDRTTVRAELPRARAAEADDLEARVAGTIARVRKEGFAAVADLTREFDGIDLTALRVPESAVREAAAALTPQMRSALEQAIDRARTFANAQFPKPVSVDYPGGATVSLEWEPVQRAGLYVPGGKAVYPSSVVMNVVPAQAAGVDSIALVSPPQRAFGGSPHPSILAASELLGVDEIYAIGGAQAIAALAFGIAEHDAERAVPAVDVITGPGNVYVAAAKRLVRGIVGVDVEAGATEVMILADGCADPTLIAMDMICQAEHDENAAAILVTPSGSLIAAVGAELDRRAPRTANRERVRAALGGAQSGLVLVDDITHGVEVVSAYAPEHLEVHTEDAAAVAGRVTGAGAIFIGASTPVSLGDYAAGSNHVLPTGGTATFSSGLSVFSFLRNVQHISYSTDSLAPLRDAIATLSSAEHLPAHGDAFEARFPHAPPAP